MIQSDSEIEMIHIKDDMSFLNWDGLESVDMMAFNQLLYQTRENGIPVNVTGDNIPTLFSKLCPLKELVMQSIVAKITAIGRRIILVDGFLLYAKKSTIEMFDLKIFMVGQLIMVKP